jgi:DNA-binding transcriptional LysR family regulator
MSIELVLTDRQAELVEEKFDLGFRSGPLKDTSLVAYELWRAQPRCFAARENLRRVAPAARVFLLIAQRHLERQGW